MKKAIAAIRYKKDDLTMNLLELDFPHDKTGIVSAESERIRQGIIDISLDDFPINTGNSNRRIEVLNIDIGWDFILYNRFNAENGFQTGCRTKEMSVHGLC